MSILGKLTEGIVEKDLKREGAALLNKWEKTGLLEGLKNDRQRESMARLLENQAKQLLKEASAMQTGDVEGFASVAFPIVRRVFGGLIANDLVSVQPMSLPSGLIFFLDFTFTDTKANAGAVAAESLYGGGVVGSQITGGVDLDDLSVANDLWNAEKSAYNLNGGYSSPTGSATVSLTFLAARSGSGTWTKAGTAADRGDTNYVNEGDRLINYDPDLSGSIIAVYKVPKSSFTNLDNDNLTSIHIVSTGSMAPFAQVRRLTRNENILSGSQGQLLVVFATHNSGSEDTLASNVDATANIAATIGGTQTATYTVRNAFTAANAVGAVVGTTPWGLEGTADLAGQTGLNDDIPEIDIKVDSVSVTAQDKKLKAKWSPELGDDINAYHSLDAEVELTSILSQQIELEIDQEILQDLVKGATGAVKYWSRRPGKFVNRDTGLDISNGTSPPEFTGNVSEWNQTLLETVNDVSATIYRKTRTGGANFLVFGPEMASILEMTAGFQANVQVDSDTGNAGAVNIGSISRKWDCYLTPYFPRNLILVGRKGGSFLESGYVYAPYIPLQVSPVVLGIEDFNPRRMVRTRYAKKMVKADMYGLVIVQDLIG